MFIAIDSVYNVSQFITLILIFAFVLVLTYFTTKYVANYQKGNMAQSNIRIIEGAKIAQNKFIEIVKIGNKYYALAVCKDSVTVICEIDESELIFKEDKEVGNFSDVLKKLTSKTSKAEIKDEEKKE